MKPLGPRCSRLPLCFLCLFLTHFNRTFPATSAWVSFEPHSPNVHCLARAPHAFPFREPLSPMGADKAVGIRAEGQGTACTFDS